VSKDNTECPWCDESLEGFEALATDEDGEKMHLACYAAEQDEIGFDNDFGCNG